jgi:hypothetical protein
LKLSIYTTVRAVLMVLAVGVFAQDYDKIIQDAIKHDATGKWASEVLREKVG